MENNIKNKKNNILCEFSVPMPFSKEFIDDIVEVNSKVNKSRITSLYFSLPINSPNNCGFEQSRFSCDNTDIDYYIDLINYADIRGFEVVYLLNSPKPFIPESKALDVHLDKLDRLLNYFKKTNLRKLRVTNTQLMGYIIKNYSDFKICASTSLEYTNMKQFNKFFEFFPQISEIIPSFDCNKNFKLLKNLKNHIHDINIELMVNEGCMAGCPLRLHHYLSVPYTYNKTYSERDENLRIGYFLSKCNKYQLNNIFQEICLSNLIYPWDIEEYLKIGINKFKIIGRGTKNFFENGNKNIYETFLLGVEDYSLIENMPYGNLNFYNSDLKIKIKDIREYLPKIKYFVKNGHLCSSRCYEECKYCYNCAKKLKNNKAQYFKTDKL